jgi:hypothetical protein
VFTLLNIFNSTGQAGEGGQQGGQSPAMFQLAKFKPDERVKVHGFRLKHNF